MSGANCTCYTGTPINNADGSCGCTGGIKSPIRFNRQRAINNLTPPFQRPIFDPSLVSSTEPNLSTIKCNSQSAPAGYQYIWDGKQCNLAVDYGYNPSGLTGTATTSTVTTALPAQVQNLLTQHKGLIISALVIGGYFLFAHGKKGSTRERDVITKRY